MSENENGTKGRKPDFIAYNVQESRDGTGIWNRIGAAWQHKDGRGLEVNLSSVPVDGRVTLREQREERMEAYEEENAREKAKPERTQRRGFSRTR